MHSGSKRRFTDMSPSLSRHKSEFIPTKKQKFYRSKKFMTLIKEDEEIIAEPLMLEKTLSMIPDTNFDNQNDPSHDYCPTILSRQVSGQSNSKARPFNADAQMRLQNRIQTSSVFYIILSYLSQLQIIKTQLVNKRFYNLYVPVVSSMVTSVGVTPFKMRQTMRCMVLPGQRNLHVL